MNRSSAHTRSLQIIEDTAGVATLIFDPSRKAMPVSDSFGSRHGVNFRQQRNCSIDHVEGDENLRDKSLVLDFKNWSGTQHSSNIFEGGTTNDLKVHFVITAARSLSGNAKHESAGMLNNQSDGSALLSMEPSGCFALALFGDALLMASDSEGAPNRKDRADSLRPTCCLTRPQRFPEHLQEYQHGDEGHYRHCRHEQHMSPIEQFTHAHPIGKAAILPRQFV